MPKTLLLADDSVTIQKVVGITFANEDVELLTVDNGVDALARARERRPDLVLADVGMPGMDGYELCAALKADPELSTIPVMLLTGTFEGFDEDRMAEVRADGHISKPFEAQMLVDRVWQMLREHAAGAKAPSAAPAVPAPLTAPQRAPMPPTASQARVGAPMPPTAAQARVGAPKPPTAPPARVGAPKLPPAPPAPVGGPAPSRPAPIAPRAAPSEPEPKLSRPAPDPVRAPAPPASPPSNTPPAPLAQVPLAHAPVHSPAPPPAAPSPRAAKPPAPASPGAPPEFEEPSFRILARDESVDDEELPRPVARGRSGYREDPGFSFEDLDFAGPTDATQVIGPAAPPADPAVEEALYDESGFLRARSGTELVPEGETFEPTDGGGPAHPAPERSADSYPGPEDTHSSVFGEELLGSSLGESTDGAQATAPARAMGDTEEDAPLVEGLEPIESLDEDDDDPATESTLEPPPALPQLHAFARGPLPVVAASFDDSEPADLGELSDAELEPLEDPDPRLAFTGEHSVRPDFAQAFVAERPPSLPAEDADPAELWRSVVPRAEVAPRTRTPASPGADTDPLAGELEDEWPVKPPIAEAASPPRGLVELEPVSPAEIAAAASATTQPLSPAVQQLAFDGRALQDALEKVAWEAFGSLSEQLVGGILKQIEQVAWETIPKLAERLIREEIERLQRDED